MAEGYLSMSAATVLQAIAHGYLYGFDIMDATGLPSGTVYPALRRMEAAGLITSRWEAADLAQHDQRPARKYYEVLRSGQLALEHAAGRYRFATRMSVRRSKPSPAKR